MSTVSGVSSVTSSSSNASRSSFVRTLSSIIMLSTSSGRLSSNSETIIGGSSSSKLSVTLSATTADATTASAVLSDVFSALFAGVYESNALLKESAFIHLASGANWQAIKITFARSASAFSGAGNGTPLILLIIASLFSSAEEFSSINGSRLEL